MRYSSLFTVALAALAKTASAVGVVGAAEGFAKGVTGGGSATPVYPSTNAQLISYLGDSQSRVIVLSKTFDFTNTEGTTTATGCRPDSNTCGSSGQDAINQNNWCGNYQPDAPDVSVHYDNAAILGILVASHKTIIGTGTAGVIKGKGLRIVSGASNVIIQNIHITDLNPEYIWGGDAITLNNCDMVWIDHVKTSLIGRQHIVLGTQASNRVTISNTEIDGYTPWSATCDDHHYWSLYFTGSADLVTFKGNYIHHTSGRSPKVGGNSLIHAVNNYWYANSGHAFDVAAGGQVLAEGNVFQNVVTPLLAPVGGQVFTSPTTAANTVCAQYLGHNCQLNSFGSSGTFNKADTGFLANFKGKNIASAAAPGTVVASVTKNAGVGKI